MHCPKCDAELEYEGADPDVGVFGSGYYCEACDEFHEAEYEPMEGDVAISFAPADKPLGTPLSQLSGRPGHPGYAEFCRIAKTYGHD